MSDLVPTGLVENLKQRLAEFSQLESYVYSIKMVHKFRGISVREGMLFAGPAGWAEWSPFTEYQVEEAAMWLNATLEQALVTAPPADRKTIPVNVTVPVVSPEKASQIVANSGCATAKVKVGDPTLVPGADQTSGNLAEVVKKADLARLIAVRQALGDTGKIRVDANCAWSVAEAVDNLASFAEVGLEYAEQPCKTTAELAELRHRLAKAGIPVKIAADESIRKFHDWHKVKQLGAADVAILKWQPLGGIKNCLTIAEKLQLPCVVSSALETSVGISAGLQLAGQLPGLTHACGLNTVALLTKDVTDSPLVSRQTSPGETGQLGAITFRKITPTPNDLAKITADSARQKWWRNRLGQCLDWLANQSAA